MTDGENDDEYRLRPEYASGLSGVFKDVPLNGNHILLFHSGSGNAIGETMGGLLTTKSISMP